MAALFGSGAGGAAGSSTLGSAVQGAAVNAAMQPPPQQPGMQMASTNPGSQTPIVGGAFANTLQPYQASAPGPISPETAKTFAAGLQKGPDAYGNLLTFLNKLGIMGQSSGTSQPKK